MSEKACEKPKETNTDPLMNEAKKKLDSLFCVPANKELFLNLCNSIKLFACQVEENGCKKWTQIWIKWLKLDICKK